MVVLENNTNKRCNATLWRINQNSKIELERPSKSNRKFIFVEENGWQAEI